MRSFRTNKSAVFAAAALSLLSITACSTQPKAPAAVVNVLAPGGKLRAAINYGNPILAGKDAATGEPMGVSVDLALELARRLDVPLELITFNAAGKASEAVAGNSVDIAFYAIDPKRAEDSLFTGPYVVIEGAYMVRQDSPIHSNGQVDRAGNRVVVGKGGAYDLYLSRELKQAELVRAPTSPEVAEVFLRQQLDVAAGVKQQMQADAKRVPGLRLLDGRFMEIRQAMAIPKNRAAALSYLSDFVEEMKRSGFVANALARHHIEGAEVAPASP
ncbi:ABC transporter substrate-binding protein [Undibacterium sp.]|jgi:polar amino acid transport system substrate-binding protein|uniref:ABC transporter substrate-binding protein n=1 Tax=Undibacterium sp. TaxID=1914977 RepID=UPI002C4FD347|nr:ABC transporter substrate-binding protein [Undibacterium sp.]HTD05319.1 ABC transporter substrate-binding protein [Undibacterium sp.]